MILFKGWLAYKKKILLSLFVNGTQRSQGFRATWRRNISFYYYSQYSIDRDLRRMKGWPSGFKFGTLGLGIQCPNQEAISVYLKRSEYQIYIAYFVVPYGYQLIWENLLCVTWKLCFSSLRGNEILSICKKSWENCSNMYLQIVLLQFRGLCCVCLFAF